MSEIKYSINSEIDNAFPYINRLNEQMKAQKKGVYSETNYNVSFIKLIKYYFKSKNNSKENSNINRAKKYIKSRSYYKDGYTFTIRLDSFINNDSLNNCEMFEIFVNIKYNKEKIEKQLYTITNNWSKASSKFYNLEGMFKHLTRRDIIEMIIKDCNDKLNK